MSVLPPHLEFSATALLDMSVRGADRFSARDLSYVLAVIWLAQRQPAFDAAHGIWRLPDNRLRAALGRTRRSGEDAEIARFVRLRESTINFPDIGTFSMPTTMFRNDMPIRHSFDDELAWVIHPDLLHIFTPQGDDDRAVIPLDLLANGSHRFGVELTLKLLALHARGPGQLNLLQWEPTHFARRMGLKDFYAFVNLPIIAPSVLEQKWIRPAVEDAWNAAGISIDIELRRAATYRHPVGKVRDLVVFLKKKELSRILDAEPVPERQGGWQTPPKSKRPPKVEPAPNVVPFAKMARTILPSLKVNAGFSRPTGREHEEPDTYEF